MKPLAALCTAILYSTLAPVLAQGTVDRDRAAFMAGLEDAEDLGRREKWEQATESVKALCLMHAEEPYVFLNHPRIAELLSSCAFRSQNEPPDPENLVSGELLSYSESGGNLRIRYTRERMGDFEAITGDHSLQWFHPAPFAGPYSVEIRGPSYSRPSRYWGLPQVIVCGDHEQGDAIRVVFGLKPYRSGNLRYGAPVKLQLTGIGHTETLGLKDPSPVENEEPYVLKVEVGHSSVGVKYNGRQLLKERRPEELSFGSIALVDLPPFDEVLIRGKAQRSWIQGLVDAAHMEQRARFDSEFDLAALVPDWLRLEKIDAFDPLPYDLSPIPGPARAGQATLHAEALALLEGESFEAGLEFALALPKQETTEVFRRWWLAVFSLCNDRMLRASRNCDRVLDDAPDFLPARFLRAELDHRLARWDKASTAYAELLTDHRAERWIYPRLALLHLRKGRLSSAADVIERAAEASAYTVDLDEINTVRIKALRGPSWRQFHEYRSDNYHVFSDIDRKTCREAAEVLESGLKRFAHRLHPVPGLDEHPFRVYLFSGRAGYQGYTRDIRHEAENSAGIYSPALKQLLIWNVPERENMLETARHEGLHQYLDRMMDDPPRWFNEGLAEYFEEADFTKSRSNEIPLQPEYIAILREAGLVRLSDFVYMGAREFMSNAGLHYPQAWALVHFLRHSSPENEQRFQKLFELLMAGVDNREAIEQALGDGLQELDREFRAYFASLGE